MRKTHKDNLAKSPSSREQQQHLHQSGRVKGRKEGGSILVAALLIMVLVGVVLTSYMGRVMSEQRLTKRSLVWNAAIPLIDAGIEEALAHLNKNVLTNELNLDGDFKPTADGWKEIESKVYEMSRAGETWSTNLNADYYTVRINLRHPWQPEVLAASYMRAPLAGPTFATIGWTQFPERTGFVSRKVKAVTSLDPIFPKGLIAKGMAV